MASGLSRHALHLSCQPCTHAARDTAFSGTRDGAVERPHIVIVSTRSLRHSHSRPKFAPVCPRPSGGCALSALRASKSRQRKCADSFKPSIES